MKMPTEAHVDFPVDFDGRVLPIPLGRIYLAGHCGRLVMDPDGQMRLVIARAAIDEGAIIVVEGPTPGQLQYGFGVSTNDERG